jgi:hypothetical protein
MLFRRFHKNGEKLLYFKGCSLMRNYVRTILASATITAGILAISSPASAAVTITQSPGAEQPEENVQLDTDTTPGDNVVRGTTNQTNSKVLFTSTSDSLRSAPQGQAEIEAINASSIPFIGTGAFNDAADGLDNLTFRLEDMSTFLEAEFNIDASRDGTVTIRALDAANMLIQSMTVNVFEVDAAGQNFFGFLADNTTPITSIEITAGTARIASIGQFRVGGITGAVPEPSTWMLMLLGMAGVGFTMRRKEKNTLRVRYA